MSWSNCEESQYRTEGDADLCYMLQNSIIELILVMQNYISYNYAEGKELYFSKQKAVLIQFTEIQVIWLFIME